MATPIARNDAGFTENELREALGLPVTLSAPVTSVCLDSRAVRPGDLFVAVAGGHGYVQAALDAGALAAVVSETVEVSTRTPGCLVSVPDSVEALGALARFHRRRWGGPLAGLTGSVGKTSTRALLHAALGGDGAGVLATDGNLNNRIGVPMTLLRLRAEHRRAVIEMGTSGPGEIGELARMAEPEVGIVIRVAKAHTERLGGLDGVAREKTALLRETHGRGGVAVLNGDDERLCAHFAPRDGRVRTFGMGGHNGIVVEPGALEVRATGSMAVMQRYTVTAQGHTVSGTLGLLGEHAASNAAAALAVALLWDEPLALAMERMASVPPEPGRLCAHRTGGAGDLWVLDDSYNASPASVRAALRACVQLGRGLGGSAPVGLVLGDMAELGAHAAEEHRGVLRDALALEPVVLVAVGGHMAQAARGVRHGALVCAPDSEAALDVVRARRSDLSLLLVKGSRSVALERVVEGIL